MFGTLLIKLFLLFIQVISVEVQLSSLLFDQLLLLHKLQSLHLNLVSNCVNVLLGRYKSVVNHLWQRLRAFSSLNRESVFIGPVCQVERTKSHDTAHKFI